MENWSIKSVGEVGSVRKTSSAYRTEKFEIEKIMPPPVHPSFRQSQSATIKTRSKIGWLAASQ
jgi:hypothetical protein